jgi:hypothetical protein
MKWRERVVPVNTVIGLDGFEQEIDDFFKQDPNDHVIGEVVDWSDNIGFVDIRFDHVSDDIGGSYQIMQGGTRWGNSQALFVNGDMVHGNVITGVNDFSWNFRINFRGFGVPEYNTREFMENPGNFFMLVDSDNDNKPHVIRMLSIKGYGNIIRSS